MDFQQRVKECFLTEKGTPLKKAKILDCCEPGRPLFARTYSYSIINFAMRVFYLGEKDYFQEANDALLENCRFYIDNKICRDDRDSFYWSIDIFCRIVEFFGSHGSVTPGLLYRSTEEKFLEMAYCWCKNNSVPDMWEYKKCGTWNVHESENHHSQGFTTCWHLSKLMMQDAFSCDWKYDDGRTAKEHFLNWSEYINVWISERARKSLFVECANGHYACETLKGIYNVFDFTPDEKTKRLARNLLDLYYATWAEEQLNGVRGGGKTRIYPNLSIKGNDGIRGWMYYYLGIGQKRTPGGNDYTVMTSAYRPLDIIAKLALRPQQRGAYEIKSQPLGLCEKGYYRNPDYRLKRDSGGICRYSYATEKYIIGSLITAPREFTDWTLISSQNRFQGVIFGSHPDARIVPIPECLASDKTPIMRSYNQHYSAQRKSCLITQKLETSVDTGPMRVFFSRAGELDRLIEKNGWLFSRTEGAFAAVYIADGGYELISTDAGVYAVCKNQYSPVILETALESESAELDAFIDAILKNPLTQSEALLRYTSLNGDEFEFRKDYSALPTINGKAALQQSDMAFESPFVRGKWNEGIVTVSFDGETKTLDFRL